VINDEEDPSSPTFTILKLVPMMLPARSPVTTLINESGPVAWKVKAIWVLVSAFRAVREYSRKNGARLRSIFVVCSARTQVRHLEPVKHVGASFR
jgi:hypothetical protein